MNDTLNQLYAREPWLNRIFKRSVYPTCCFNLGPQSVCAEHLDAENAPASWCSIHALGNYNPDSGGHFVLFDFGLVIRFPPGSTVLIPSATLRHGNTVVQKDEKRFSFTAYCPGGLFRWVTYGFKLEEDLAPGEKERMVGDGTARFQSVLSLFSKESELVQDRRQVFHMCK